MELRFRQIHLDFHTSELIDDIGGRFDPYEFAATLKKAAVDSITCFARCHHGMMYYDSEKFPERIHPGLKNKDLLKEQIKACHKEGIKVPVYITVQWDYYTSVKNPEWLMRNEDGSPVFQHSLKPGFYHGLCVNTPYVDFLKEHTREVITSLDADGVFFDIVGEKPCACEYCIASMRKRGYNPLSKEERYKHYEEVLFNFRKVMYELVHSIKPGISVFFNSGHINYHTKNIKDFYTHFELESLPSGEWGYIHFPVTVRYARNLNKDYLAHTGKFHTTWGDFHSFKNREALQYECFRMLALNSKCLIGDQLEPSGKLSEPVYDLIGSVYREVEKKEKWCKDAVPVTEIGVLTPDEFIQSGIGQLPHAQTGVTHILEQCAYQFDFIDSEMDFRRFKLLILPDSIPVDEKLKCKISEYIANGGKVLASFESGMDKDKKKFNLEELKVEVSNVTYDDYNQPVKGRLMSSNDFSDYIVPEGDIGKELYQTEYVMYAKGTEVTAKGGVSLMKAYSSYFDRSYKHFCSHRQTPSSGKPAYDACVMGHNTIYFSHPVFGIYSSRAPKWIKVIVRNAISMLLDSKLVDHNGPSTIETALNKQKSAYILHLLHYIPQRKSAEIDIIEDIIPLFNIKMRLNLPEEVKAVRIVPNGSSLEYVNNKGEIEFTIPEIAGHTMVEISI